MNIPNIYNQNIGSKKQEKNEPHYLSTLGASF